MSDSNSHPAGADPASTLNRSFTNPQSGHIMPRIRLEILRAVTLMQLMESVTVCKRSSEVCKGLDRFQKGRAVENFEMVQAKELFRKEIGPKIARLIHIGVARHQPMFCLTQLL